MLWLLLACGVSAPPGSPAEGMRERKFRVLTVDCKGGADYDDIDSAISDAKSGDRIEVAPCTYQGTISFKGRAVRIVATGGPDVTKIVADPGEPAVKAKKGEAAMAVLEGFTISGGGGPEEPAIHVSFSSLTLKDCVITGNTGTNTLYSVAGHVVLDGCTIEDNTTSEGIILRQRRGMTALKDSTLRCGDQAVGYTTEHGASFVDGSTLECAGQTPVLVHNSDGRLQRSVLRGVVQIENEILEDSVERNIIEDSVLLDGAKILTAHTTLRNVVSLGTLDLDGATVVLEASVITGASCGIRSADSVLSVRYTDFWKNTADTCGDAIELGDDNLLAVDPQFVDTGNRDFHLKSGSQLVNAGPNEYGYADADGSVNDLGVYGGPLTIGGGW
jgi:hypothetical protein